MNNELPANFNTQFHKLLKSNFLEWKERAEYERVHRKLYDKAHIKIRMYKFFSNDLDKILTSEEIDAVNYVLDWGIYKYSRHYGQKISIFDTKESFLFKMHNEHKRNAFLKTYEYRNPQ